MCHTTRSVRSTNLHYRHPPTRRTTRLDPHRHEKSRRSMPKHSAGCSQTFEEHGCALAPRRKVADKSNGRGEFSTEFPLQDSDGAGRGDRGLKNQDGRQRAEDRPPIGSFSFSHPHTAASHVSLVSSCFDQYASRGFWSLRDFDSILRIHRLDSLSSSNRILPKLRSTLSLVMRSFDSCAHA